MPKTFGQYCICCIILPYYSSAFLYQHIHVSLAVCSLSVWLHDGPFFHIHTPKWICHGFDFPHGYAGRDSDSGTIVINSLLKLWSTALSLFFSPPPDSPLSPPTFLSIAIFSEWWIGFQLLRVNTISCGSCPILPQRHMCGDTDQRRNQHFRAMGLGCMQHKTSNGGFASDSYWCTLGLYVAEHADRSSVQDGRNMWKWWDPNSKF